MIEKTAIIECLEEVRKISKKRNFVQSVDLIIVLKNIDSKNFRLSEEIILPHSPGKKKRVVLFSDTFKVEDVRTITSADLKELEGKKKKSRKLAKSFDFALAEPKLMTLIGRILGPFLGPKGKMPKIVTSEKGLKERIKKLEKGVRIRSKGSLSLQCSVGNEKMSNKEIAENVISVIESLIQKLPEGEKNIKKILIKLTMGPPVEVKIK